MSMDTLLKVKIQCCETFHVYSRPSITMTVKGTRMRRNTFEVHIVTPGGGGALLQK